MDRPRLIRGLRIAVSAIFATLCLLLIALWARSQTTEDILMGNALDEQMLVVISQPGRVALFNYSQVKIEWRHTQNEVHRMGELGLVDGLTGTPVECRWGFALKRLSRGLAVVTPYWFLVLLSATLSVTPWIPWKWSFSLRTLLIATTLIAVALGLVVYLMR